MKNKKYFFIIFLFSIFLLAGCFQERDKENAPMEKQTAINQEIDMNKYKEPPKPANPDKLAPGLVPGNNTTTETKNSEKEEIDEEFDEEKKYEFAEKYKAAVMETNMGDIKLEFFNEDSPKTVNNFLKLASEGFYDGTKFHRVIKDFMIQGGDPNSKDDDWSDDGQGGPGYEFKDEINSYKLVRGSLAMANSGPDTNGSQFFIITADSTPHLDGKHTNFGKVTDGMDVVEEIEEVDTNNKDHPEEDMVIESIELIEQ